ncbi:MAG: hypothetical protein KKB45_17785, partial [Gammaproteobacteria bacterium]|nr:hypothetical protein [Gammaproteobacteria bacterium]
MKQQLTPKPTVWQQLLPYWQISFQCSREYKLAFVASLVIGFLMYWAVLQSVYSDPTSGRTLAFLLRSVLDSSCFVLFCHFLIRPYLKLHFIPKGRFGWELVQLLLWLYVLGVVSMLLTMSFGKIEFLDVTDITELVFTSPQGQHQLRIDNNSIILLGGFNQAFTFAVWSLIYVMWQSIKSKKQMQIQMQQTQL